MFQLIAESEYGEREIVSRSENALELVEEAHKLATQENLDNALTPEEQIREFECYCVDFCDPETDEIVDDVIYAGKRGVSNHRAIYFGDNEEGEIYDLEALNVYPRFYIGEFVKDRNKNIVEYYYLRDVRGNEVRSFVSQDTNRPNSQLQGRTVYYVTKV